MKHDDLGKVTVDSVEPKSRTLLNVTCIDRGKGWNEISQSYTGVKTSVGWYRGENREFNSKHLVHYNKLKQI